MSKTVTIPSYKNPFDVEINGVKYSYKAGATVSVPDEVAALIEANAKNAPQENDPTIRLVTEIGENPTDKEVASAKATAEAIEEKGLPDVTASDNGKLLGVNDGKWAKLTPDFGTVPTITIDATQIVSVDPPKAQLTDEQYELFTSTAPVIMVEVPAMNLEVPFFYSMGSNRASVFSPGAESLKATGIHVTEYDKQIELISFIEIKDGYYLYETSFTYGLYDQSFIDNDDLYKTAQYFNSYSSYVMPTLRVIDSLDGTGGYTLAFHCSSITPITDGYHYVFIHDEYDEEESKMAYTVFSFDVDSSNNVTNQLYNRYYA